MCFEPDMRGWIVPGQSFGRVLRRLDGGAGAWCNYNQTTGVRVCEAQRPNGADVLMVNTGPGGILPIIWACQTGGYNLNTGKCAPQPAFFSKNLNAACEPGIDNGTYFPPLSQDGRLLSECKIGLMCNDTTKKCVKQKSVEDIELVAGIDCTYEDGSPRNSDCPQSEYTLSRMLCLCAAPGAAGPKCVFQYPNDMIQEYMPSQLTAAPCSAIPLGDGDGSCVLSSEYQQVADLEDWVGSCQSKMTKCTTAEFEFQGTSHLVGQIRDGYAPGRTEVCGTSIPVPYNPPAGCSGSSGFAVAPSVLVVLVGLVSLLL